MHSRNRHLHVLRQRLNQLLTDPAAAPLQEQRLGCDGGVLASLRWLQQAPFTSDAGRRPVLTLAFGDGCPGRYLPRALRSPLDGSLIPVRSIRGDAAGGLHAGSWIRLENLQHRGAPPVMGTLGAILRNARNPARVLGLTAGHVLGVGRGSLRGDTVELSAGPTTPAVGGRLFDWRPNFAQPHAATEVDAAIVELEASAVESLQLNPADWPRGWSSPFGDDLLQLRSQQRVFSGGNPEYISCRMEVSQLTNLSYLVTDALCWSAEPGFAGGDSGAPIWNGAEELVAIHTGGAPMGSAQNAVAIPIGRILRWADAEVIARGQSLVRRAPSSNGRSLAAIAAPAQAPATPGQVSREIDTLARTMWGEARGEPDPALGMSAVAHVVLNRFARQTYWGHSIAEVCRRPFQFSCWNQRDVNLPKLLQVSSADPRFALALQLAARLAGMSDLARGNDDPTGAATHYHARALQPLPRWARGKTPCARLGNHLFYRDVG
jgi:hypothetical protein